MSIQWSKRRWTVDTTHSNRFPVGCIHSWVQFLALASLSRFLKAMGMSPRRFAETGQSRGWSYLMTPKDAESRVAVAVGCFESLAAAVSRSQ